MEIEKISTSSLKIINYAVTWKHPARTEFHRIHMFCFFFTIYNNTSKNIKLDPIYTMIYYNGLKLGLDLTNAFPHHCIQKRI